MHIIRNWTMPLSVTTKSRKDPTLNSELFNCYLKNKKNSCLNLFSVHIISRPWLLDKAIM